MGFFDFIKVGQEYNELARSLGSLYTKIIILKARLDSNGPDSEFYSLFYTAAVEAKRKIMDNETLQKCSLQRIIYIDEMGGKTNLQIALHHIYLSADFSE